ncbi:hypothetical protein F5Y03DRAFT_399660 [Xylaria venustula]|nr:hypothetical protein F5Y03DRAFT_399660 [Xylaria venustula]
MADQDMRLRLVVRRNGLPELRLMWHVQLDTNPTISRLLEQLNDQVPLESDDWGLEDYVVELHDSDGTDFECLHYQLVRSVLKPDDRVFIRALDRDDHRRRRVSGRHQVSSDGRHLIDGVPFGRPHLRSTTGRPGIHIPPLKRARHTYTQQDGGDSDASFESEGNSPIGLLTNRESYGDGSMILGGFDDADSNVDDTDFEDHDAELSNPGSSPGGPRDEEEGDEEEEEGGDPSEEDEEDISECDEDEDLGQEALDLANEIAALEGHDPSSAPAMGLDTLDKLSALRAALPTAPIDRCERMLAVCGGDLKTTYNTLRRKYLPIMSLKAVLSWEPGNKITSENLRKPQPPVNSASASKNASQSLTGKRKFHEQSPVDDSDDDDHESTDDSLMRKYDHAGFPPGTITSGKGLAHMAEISASFDNNKINGNSEATSTTLKASTNEPIDEEENDDTSSSGSSSDSSTSSDESDSASEDGSSSGHSSSNQSSSADSDDSDLDDDDDSSNESKRLAANDVHSSSESDTNDSDSDSGPEEHSSKVTSRDNPTAEDKGSKDSSESSDSSSNSDSSSESEEDTDDEFPSIEVSTTKDIKVSQILEQPHPLSSKPKEAMSTPLLVPPGAGKESTRRRNARRRAAKVAKRKVQELPVDVTNANAMDHIPVKDGRNPGVGDDATALFEARRKALLEAIAAGGIEVGPSGETTIDESFAEADRTKRKRTEGSTNSQQDENEALTQTPTKSPSDNQAESANQKKRRIDIGAGRRLVFGALGVRNPKNKEDEDKLRDQLQAAAKPRVTLEGASRTQPTLDEAERVDEEQQDLDSWKLKINYRAVECCQDNTELSPAPFPFQQRWDPQQQRPSLSKKNKRGGQGKRARRDHSQYYEDSHFDKKRKYRHSYDFEDGAYDEEGDPTNEFDITLNYDDAENQDGDQDHEMAHETSQTTDLDDLPSLPKDVSELPILRPGEAKAGMVIAWLKWTCSSATGWQPQVSRVTAIVARVNDDATMLNVCLAKRDRYLDESEKRYDHVTGKRIYGRFEAPDLSEEEEINDDGDAGADEGYRDIAWTDIQDPRILQYPLNPTAESDSNHEYNNSMDSETTRKSETSVEPTALLAPGHQELDPISSSARPNYSEPVQTTGEASFSVDENAKQSDLTKEGPNDSGVMSSVKAASNATSHQDGQNQQTTDLAMSDTSQVSSPSRQLLDMSSNSPVYDWAPTSSIELEESPRADIPSSMPVSASASFQSRPEEGPRVSSEVPLQEVIPSSVSSVHGGRQLDYAMIDDSYLPDTFDATDDTDHQDYEHGHNATPPARSSLTPIPNRRTVTPDPNDKLIKPGKIMGSSPSASSISSLPSLSTLWCSARTSHSTQSSSKAPESSVISKPPAPKFPRDAKYEEAMRKLDEESDEAASPVPADKNFQVKREPSTQFQATRVVKTISPPPMRRRFTIPPGSQVVELSSDSESAYSEKYADDAADENYTPRSDSLPKGEGWVKKRQKARKSVI